MKLLKILGSSIFQLLSLSFVFAYLLGILNLYFSDKNNYCLMTYMYEYPQFVRLSFLENNIYPQYGLYAYSEGRFTEKARKMWFDGVPVLFLPGNSGSHMQARSVASVALRKALSKEYSYHFDFFTINYNEELSGLYGGVLQRQTEFASISINKILSLYKNNKYTKTVPNSVLIIGHSMGGLIAKRLLAYPETINKTSIAIALAAPLEAPVINTDVAMNNYYMFMDFEWDILINKDDQMKEKKMLISLGNGPRDVLVPAGLTSSNDSYINALTTAVPGVWVSPDHVCIVWCKQLVMVINRYLFSIIDPVTEQIVEDGRIIKERARQYFQANRSTILSPVVTRPTMAMIPDAFWYEDNRRVYQVARPQIDKTTYLMIRLVGYPQNRFVAIESVNVDDKEWVFGCNAKYTYNMYRYCKDAISLSELSRWTGAATDFGRRKLATIHLHKIKEDNPDWTHVIVRVSPTRKPIVLNVDINDHASRQIHVNVPSDFSFGKTVIKQKTEEDSLYYELILRDFNVIHQAYLLYVEPTAGCEASQHHASAELHVPWVANHEYYHYFTHLKQNPMKLRLYKSNPNITYGLDPTEHVKVTLLLDPQCTYTISISTSWYHRLAQLARNFTPVLVPYVAAIVLLAARSSILHVRERGTFVSVHAALMSDGVKPYYALVFARLGAVVFMSIPLLSFLFKNASWRNQELQYFTRSLLVLPAYMTALGVLNLGAAAILAVMVFSSQIAHRLLFRIVWRGGTSFAEKMASVLQKVPIVVSTALVCTAPISCGAAALAVGAAFYAFMLSKMYEEYLEDYVYKIMAKIASKICCIFRRKDTRSVSETSLVKSDLSDKNSDAKVPDNVNNDDETNSSEEVFGDVKAIEDDNKERTNESEKNDIDVPESKNNETSPKTCTENEEVQKHVDVDEELNNLNFHMMMFLMWIIVTLVNVPALLTWAKNFTYSKALNPDTSFHTGLIMSACSSYLWQMNGPRRNLRYYEAVAALLFTMAVFILALGPMSLVIVNYGVTFMFAVITLQQLLDKEDSRKETSASNNDIQDGSNDEGTSNKKSGDEKSEGSQEEPNLDNLNTEDTNDDCDVCNETRIFNVFKNLREKFSVSDNL